ncbi:hypothetical protein HFK83_03335 [Ralstonia pseudosolanacearum]|uniref:hypothetical protein n=1 Tax=Ralstonia solanacearum species complex TaxID=3116862 RepID=UPI0002E9BEB8|nr:hypothetical protein [Ralstonia pseudosolanacearum]MCK4121403.1 hypothetical protein [Ralstonia pseudosolanacearum]
MPINGYSVGRDYTLVIQTATGPLQLNKVTSFKSKQDVTDVRVKRLDGITDHVRFFDGHSGSFDIERQDPNVDRYFAQLESNYYAGINEQPAQIYETIQEANGAVSQFRYDGVLMTLADAGNRAGDATIKQSINFVASRRILVQ